MTQAPACTWNGQARITTETTNKSNLKVLQFPRGRQKEVGKWAGENIVKCAFICLQVKAQFCNRSIISHFLRLFFKLFEDNTKIKDVGIF